MKVTGGLTGITLSLSARTKFFLIAPELARLADQTKEMGGMSSKTQDRQHSLAASVAPREVKSIDQVLITMRNFTNPFKEEGDELFNLVTKVVMPENVKNNLFSKVTWERRHSKPSKKVN